VARSSRTSQAFTLIELLISVAILGVVSIYMFESFAVNQRAYTVIDQVSETQQSLRAIADLLERDIRHTGLMVPEGAAACGIDSTSAPDTLYLTDAAALDPGEDVATYDGAVVVGAVTNVSTGSNAFTLSSLVIEPAPARPSYDMNGDGTADSDFRVDGGAIVLDLNNPARGTACGRVTAINVGSSLVTVSIVTAPLAAAGGTTRLVVIPAHEYRIQNADQLMRDGVLLSEGVEDLQVAWFFDLDGDNAIDANEVLGNGTNGNYAAAGRDAGQIRELRVNVVTRTRLEDREWTQGRIQATENRGVGVVDDGFRRRVHTTTVMLRNVGARNVT
jgi:prepilin-type N-terminal cleavage/methylation domain-containing protein